MVQKNISMEEIDDIFSERFHNIFEIMIEGRRIENSRLSKNAKNSRPIGKKKNCTYKALAEEAGVNEKTFHSYMSSQNRSKRLDIVAQIAHHFNISMDYLLGFTDVKELYFDDVSTADMRKISKYTGLSSKAIKQLHKYACLKESTVTQTVNQLLEELADNHSIKEFDMLNPPEEVYTEEYIKQLEESYAELPPELRAPYTEEEAEQAYQEYQKLMDDGSAADMLYESCKTITGERVLQLIDAYLHLSMDGTEVYSVTNDGVIRDMDSMIDSDMVGISDIQVQMPGGALIEQFLMEQIKDAIKDLKYGKAVRKKSR